MKIKRALLSVWNKEGIVDLGQFLIQNGVEVKRLSVAFKGESEPKASNDTDLGMRENRRVEFVLTY